MNKIFFDTDMHIHKLSTDENVRQEAANLFNVKRPSVMSEFSLVELKGNYIASLILLRRKINDSESFEMAYHKISNSGGRRANLMLGQLVKWLGGITFPINPWSDAKNTLITYLDAQIESIWESFNNKSTFGVHFKCCKI